jgi:hypothetical protein
MAMRRRKPRADPKIAGGCIRVSTDEQTLGPEAQREALEPPRGGDAGLRHPHRGDRLLPGPVREDGDERARSPSG